MMDTTNQLLNQIEGFLAASGMSATAFGWEVMGDPKFVHDLRKTGRKVRQTTAQKATDYIRRVERRSKRAAS